MPPFGKTIVHAQYDVPIYVRRQAADGGDADAVAHLGHMYANGDGVAQNNETARQYFQASADAGNPSGQFGLGYMHFTGLGAQQDYRAAFKLFQRSSEGVSVILTPCQIIIVGRTAEVL